jgi:signal transduction histidine kinase
LFANADSATAIVVEQGERMATLDSLAVLAIGADSVRLFGVEDPAGRYYAPTPLSGPLAGSTLAIALPSWQINGSLLQMASPRQLWHNGFLTLATIVVVLFAIGSSRREMLLARARSDFVAGVSHDLRMPLAQILLAGETLVTHGDAPKRERDGLANTVVRESRRLIALVDNLLLFSRTGAVDLRPRVEPVRVDELFALAVESVELAADDARQTIDVSTSSSLGVLADAQLVRQALVNLLDNALKYGSPGQHIRLSAERAPADAVRLVVDDEGPGIPAAERERVFQPYERLGRDQTSERTGTGLGLSVVRQIVVACGGRVWLDEVPDGRGTRAVIELRAAELPSPVVTEAETA